MVFKEWHFGWNFESESLLVNQPCRGIFVTVVPQKENKFLKQHISQPCTNFGCGVHKLPRCCQACVSLHETVWWSFIPAVQCNQPPAGYTYCIICAPSGTLSLQGPVMWLPLGRQNVFYLWSCYSARSSYSRGPGHVFCPSDWLSWECLWFYSISAGKCWKSRQLKIGHGCFLPNHSCNLTIQTVLHKIVNQSGNAHFRIIIKNYYYHFHQ